MDKVIPHLARGFARRAILAAFCTGAPACETSPTAPETFEPAATIESVVTTFRGETVENGPVVIESLQWEVKLATRLPGATHVSLSVCVMETATSVGVGTCMGLSSTQR